MNDTINIKQMMIKFIKECNDIYIKIKDDKEKKTKLFEQINEIFTIHAETIDLSILHGYYWYTYLPVDILEGIIKEKYKISIRTFVREKLKHEISVTCSECNNHFKRYFDNRTSYHLYLKNGSEWDKCDECKAKIRKEIENEEKERKEKLEKIKIEEENKIKALREMPYKKYLETDHWKETRKRKLKQAKYKCELCNSKENLNVHHKTYENRGNEKDEDLVVLCYECHAKFHDKLGGGTDENIEIKLDNKIKTKFFICNLQNNQECIDIQINKFLDNTEIIEIMDIKITHENNTYTALILYKAS